MKTYSRSVWFKQVDEALYNLISNTLYYTDSKGKVQMVEPCFPKDLPDLKNKKLPTVVIKKTTSTFDITRYDPQPIVTGINPDTKTAILEESAKPYNLRYQLEILTQYQEDLDSLSRIWLSKIPHRYMLDVEDTSGVPRKCYMVQTSPPTQLNETHSGDNTLYRLVIVYTIKVELDEGIETSTNIVTDTILNQK